MKRVFKAFLLCLIFLFLSNYVQEVGAEYIPGTKCPKAPDPSLSSICGVVKSAKATPVVKNGIVTYEAPIGVPGVTVSVYECDNQSPSCKKNGDLVHPFSSTSTNEEGMFSLWARKMDNYKKDPDPLKDRNIMSKKRYLVFSCGKTLAGMQEIPSYLDFTYVIQEVNCGLMQAYTLPKNEQSVIPNEDTIPNQLLASQMGTDDMVIECNNILTNLGKNSSVYQYYCDPTSKTYKNRLTAQVSFKPEQSTTAPNGLAMIRDYTPNVSVNVDLSLENADPRFNFGNNGNDGGAAFIKAINTTGFFTSGSAIKEFDLGAYWSKDCELKYPEIEDKKFCASLGPEDYLDKLQTDGEFLIQNKLPNIPPIDEIQFYKEFPARQDITEYIQDPTDPAKFLSLQFSNCIGSVFLRKDNQVVKDKYAACSQFQKCNKKISGENSYLNVQTTGGPSKLLANPYRFQEDYNANADLNAKVCKVNPEIDSEEPIKLGQIQAPWETFDPSKHKLDSTYWSTEFIYYFGKNNVATKLPTTGQSTNDSFYATSGSPVNEKPFTAGEEAASQPVKEGTFMMITSGGKRANNTMAGAVAISSGTSPDGFSTALTGIISPPTKNETYENKILSGILVPTLGSKTMKIGEYSKVNAEPEKFVISPDEDKTIISNMLFLGNLDHHPFLDQATDDNFNGTRTATSAIYLTDTAKNRIEKLKELGSTKNDAYDSLLSTLYGKGELLFNTDWDTIKAFGQILWWNIKNPISDSKSFLDRKNAGVTLPFSVGGENQVEIRNDLKTKFTLSEKGFTGAFPLPVASNLSVTAWGGGGGDVACYGWNKIPVATEYPPKLNDETCNTYKESPDDISRTCRVDECKSVTISCSCTVIKLGNKVVGHKTSCNAPEIGQVACPIDGTDILSCAQNQFSCSDGKGGTSNEEEKCLERTYDEKIDDAESNYSAQCDGSQNSYGPNTITIPHAPACAVSRAGPYTCGGTLTKDSEFITKPEILPDNPNGSEVTPKYSDSVAIANNELRKSFQEPFGAQLTYAPAAFESVKSSITAMSAPANDIKKRKDSVGTGGDSQNGSITRGLFSAPLLTKNPVYNKVNLHCEINPNDPDNQYGAEFLANINSSKNEQKGSILWGGWSCLVNKPPEPEIVDFKDYFNDNLKNIKHNKKCDFNPSDACRDAFFSLALSEDNKGMLSDIKFSTTFTDIMNFIGSRMNMPPSIILSIISGAGKQYKWGYFFSTEGEEELKNASYAWYGALPGCDEMNTASEGPLDQLQYWFLKGLEANMDTELSGDGGKVKEALDELAERRSITATRCNFLDSVFVAAAMLRGGRFTGNATIDNTTKTCSGWTWESASMALKRYAWGWDLSNRPAGNKLFEGGITFPGDDERNTRTIFEACRY